MSDLTLRDLNRATLRRQGLLDRFTGAVADVVGRLGGLQAQHANSPHIALWSRREAHTVPDLEAALRERTVVKAAVMRDTLHIVPAGAFAAMDSVSGARNVATWTPSARRGGVDLLALNAELRTYCAEPRTVAEIEERLRARHPGKLAGTHIPSGVRNTAFRLASAGGGLVQVPPSGDWRWHGKPQYLDAEVWLGAVGRPDPEAAAVELAETYLRAYGPATERDFAKWSGLRTVTAVRRALAALGDRTVRRVGPGDLEYWDLAELGGQHDDDGAVPVRFLARWDSTIIAYADRARILPDEHRDAVVKRNGDFLPTFLVDGFVAGLWSVLVEGEAAVLRLEPFGRVSREVRSEVESEGTGLVRFVEPDAGRWEVAWV